MTRIDPRVKPFQRLAVALSAAKIVEVNYLATCVILKDKFGFTDEQLSTLREELDKYWNNVNTRQDAILRHKD